MKGRLCFRLDKKFSPKHVEQFTLMVVEIEEPDEAQCWQERG